MLNLSHIYGIYIMLECLFKKLFNQTWKSPILNTFKFWPLLFEVKLINKNLWKRSWFPYYKTVDWKEQISKSSSLSGSNIIARYINLSDDKTKKIRIKMKCRKKDRLDNIKKLHQISKMTEKELNSLQIEDDFIFIIKNNNPIDAHFKEDNINDEDFPDYLKKNFKIGQINIKKWIKKHK